MIILVELRKGMVDILDFGWKIRNYKAATIVGKNMGVRDRYDFTPATIHKSLFTNWLQKNGMKTDKKNESTRDVICIDFQFGLRSYEEEKAHLKEMRKSANKIEDKEQKAEKLKTLDDLERKVDERKHLYRKMTKAQVREYLYVNGADITYSHLDKKTGEIIDDETIHYKMLYRSPSKAKTGSAVFLREELFDKAYDWLTMGIGPRMPEKNAKIVELSAYAPLATSAIEGTFEMDVDDILVVKDQESLFNTIADIIRADDYQVYESVTNPETGKKETQLVTKKKCVVHREQTDVVNVAWDGEGLIESDILPEWCNGMALLRNHFFKACAFKTHIQKFFKDYCTEHGIDYDTFEVVDCFGKKHLARSIKFITTENATKFKKFSDLIGGDFASAYEYWKERVRADGCIWGIVKTTHPSKLGDLQRASYQAVNTLPCNEEEIYKITEISVKYVESLKFDNDAFIAYLRKNANVINSYDMLVDLYEHNPDIANTKFFRENKKHVIKNYVNVLRYGKALLPGDNLTVCGNPYGLLLHTVGEDWTTDPTLRPEEGCIQVYTKRFEDGEYLCGIRSPHNSSNNLGYFHNVRHPLMEMYFDFCPNIMAVNCICTDVQARLNGEDFDSDFNLVTNQSEMVEAARRAYRDYPTVVNEIPESGIAYDNTPEEYARMDTNMQGAQKAIGGTSDTAQLALSYYWNAIDKNEDKELINEYYNIANILAVLAQVAIDGCKRIYAVSAEDELKRIRAKACMNKDKDYPKFMKYTAKIPTTKNGKEREYDDIKADRRRVEKRINMDIVCPMNWMQERLDKIQGLNSSNGIDIFSLMAEKPKKAPTFNQMNKIRKIVEEYDAFTKYIFTNNNYDDEDDIRNDSNFSLLKDKSEEVYEAVSKMKISFPTMYRLIEASLGYEGNTRNDRKYKKLTKYTTKTLNILYRANPDLFMSCFLRKKIDDSIF